MLKNKLIFGLKKYPPQYIEISWAIMKQALREYFKIVRNELVVIKKHGTKSYAVGPDVEQDPMERGRE